MNINYFTRDYEDSGKICICFDEKEDAKTLLDRLYDEGETQINFYKANNFKKKNNVLYNRANMMGYCLLVPIPILQELIKSVKLELED